VCAVCPTGEDVTDTKTGGGKHALAPKYYFVRSSYPHGGGGGDSMAEDDLSGGPDLTVDYATYEDYLDSQISWTDMYYLEDEDLARQLVELGYRGSGETLKRDEFQARKKAAEQARLNKLRSTPKALASASKDVTGFPFLASLAEREEMVRNGKLTTIIFIRDKNSKGQEVSGYIDFAHRLKTENFEPYFERKKKLMPRPSDLSFYNWETQTSTSNATPNFQVTRASSVGVVPAALLRRRRRYSASGAPRPLHARAATRHLPAPPIPVAHACKCAGAVGSQVIADNEAGLLFKNKRDRKVINVDPKARPGDNSRRIELHTHEVSPHTSPNRVGPPRGSALIATVRASACDSTRRSCCMTTSRGERRRRRRSCFGANAASRARRSLRCGLPSARARVLSGFASRVGH
jgi:hypothetical protein